MLCFDPTRGIDIRTKNQIYVLLRDLAAAGAAVLIYTSELKEIQLVCDRAIVIFGGRVVGELDAADADEPALLRAAYNLKSDALMPEEIAAERRRRGKRRVRRAEGDRTDERGRAHRRRDPPGPVGAPSRRCAATRGRSGCSVFLGILLVFTRLIQPTYGATGVQGLANSVLPLALAAVAQAIVVISGGIDLSIGSMMALTSVVAATQMKDQSDQFARRRRDRRAAARPAARRSQRRRDRRHARGRHRRHSGDGVRVGGHGAAGPEDTGRRLGAVARGPGSRDRSGTSGSRRPASSWSSSSRSSGSPSHGRGSGLSLYAIGSNQLAAFRSGVSVGRTKIFAYMLGGLFSALGGLALTASTGRGTPVPGPLHAVERRRDRARGCQPGRRSRRSVRTI